MSGTESESESETDESSQSTTNPHDTYVEDSSSSDIPAKEKPQCPICRKIYVRHRNLQLHLRQKHGLEPKRTSCPQSKLGWAFERKLTTKEDLIPCQIPSRVVAQSASCSSSLPPTKFGKPQKKQKPMEKPMSCCSVIELEKLLHAKRMTESKANKIVKPVAPQRPISSEQTQRAVQSTFQNALQQQTYASLTREDVWSAVHVLAKEWNVSVTTEEAEPIWDKWCRLTHEHAEVSEAVSNLIRSEGTMLTTEVYAPSAESGSYGRAEDRSVPSAAYIECSKRAAQIADKITAVPSDSVTPTAAHDDFRKTAERTSNDVDPKPAETVSHVKKSVSLSEAAMTIETSAVPVVLTPTVNSVVTPTTATFSTFTVDAASQATVTCDNKGMQCCSTDPELFRHELDSDVDSSCSCSQCSATPSNHQIDPIASVEKPHKISHSGLRGVVRNIAYNNGRFTLPGMFHTVAAKAPGYSPREIEIITIATMEALSLAAKDTKVYHPIMTSDIRKWLTKVEYTAEKMQGRFEVSVDEDSLPWNQESLIDSAEFHATPVPTMQHATATSSSSLPLHPSSVSRQRNIAPVMQNPPASEEVDLVVSIDGPDEFDGMSEHGASVPTTNPVTQGQSSVPRPREPHQFHPEVLHATDESFQRHQFGHNWDGFRRGDWCEDPRPYMSFQLPPPPNRHFHQ